LTKLGRAIAAFARVIRDGKSNDRWDTPEFHDACDAAFEVRRPDSATKGNKLGWWATWTELKAFLSDSEFISAALRGGADGEVFATAFIVAAEETKCEVTTLVLVDGLDLPDEITIGDATIVPLSHDYLTEFFGGVVPADAQLRESSDVAAIRVKTKAANPPWGPGYFDWERSHVVIQRLSHPWLTYLNLISEDKVGAAGAFQRSSSLLALPLTRGSL
jgi:hypothetical protein